MKKKSLRREIIEWSLIIGVGVFLYFTGLYVEVGGKIQEVMLWTGIKQPDELLAPDERIQVNGNMHFRSTENLVTELKAYRGKVIFLNFWASWCPPCVAEMPNIHDLYLDMKDDNVVFIMISLDQDRAKAEKFIKDKEYTFPIYYPASKIPKEIYSETIPTTFVLDKQGRIAIREEGFSDYNNQGFIQSLKILSEE